LKKALSADPNNHCQQSFFIKKMRHVQTTKKPNSIPFEPLEHPHRRYNPLIGEWLLVSPQRTQRPWQGKKEVPAEASDCSYDPGCYLCPGNLRASGEKNPGYSGTYIFSNDFAALTPDTPAITTKPNSLFRARAVRGTCRVICYSPEHNKTMAQLSCDQILAIVNAWTEELLVLGKTYSWVQIFENKGALMGCSNPHPHGQIWATATLPIMAVKKNRYQARYLAANGEALLLAYAREEIARAERLVMANEDWIVVVPYWAAWPFETLLLPLAPVRHLHELNQRQRENLALILKSLTSRYDNLFQTSFPFSMGWHGAPFDGRENRHWQLHAQFLPPLLQSASVRKFMVGYELLAEAQRDLTAEQAASRLRNLADTHYLEER
jgi:UDPglucose--hexose-1-phosphate uridylyltransferase